jgi:hypothetical protein
MSNITLNVTPSRAGRFLAVAANGVGELFRDNLDLNSATGRKRFVVGTLQAAFPSRSPEDWPTDVRNELEHQLIALAAAPPGAPEPVASAASADPRVEALAKMPEDVRAEAADLLDNPQLLARISEDVMWGGVVGERRLGLSIYFVGVSAQLRKPLAMIVRGPSSSGKSHIVDCIADLFPPEVVLRATSISTNALYYFPSGTLRHRWIVAGERSRLEDDDRAEATRALREMLESGRLSKAVTVKEADRIVTELIEQEGPIAFIETTTLGTIFEEDRNRCLVVSTDERSEQTKRIMAAVAARAEGRVPLPSGRSSLRAGRSATPAEVERMQQVHHAVQRMLPRCEVVIPFAPALADLFPCDRIDARRSFRQLLQLVEVSALLHHRQRSRDELGRVKAELADYQIAAELAAGPMAIARGGVSDGARRFFESLSEKFAIESTFTSATAQRVGTWGRSAVRAWLAELDTSGVIEQTEAPRGNIPASWRFTARELSTSGGLPSVDDVMRWLSTR